MPIAADGVGKAGMKDGGADAGKSVGGKGHDPGPTVGDRALGEERERFTQERFKGGLDRGGRDLKEGGFAVEVGLTATA